MFNGVKKAIQLITESDTLIYSKKPVARGSKFQDPTRPGPRKSWPDPTRPDPMTIHDGQKCFIIARCTLSSAYTQVTSRTRKVLPRFGLIRYMFLQYERIAICTQSSLYISCFQRHCTVTTECRLTCTGYARNVGGVAVELSPMIRSWSCNKKVVMLNNSY